ncbi:sulfhydryl oxidase 2 [Chelmon rostratus]|uniref:sulfhydryl oxidase 2 n=1 Tax=Chelmon rostratus TaxID=109905 RepID=UPI001BE88C16|nr:sulfhydryl oxidase 2 [Chelmon rostratus]XP_041793277.1 sulfhydryl oxidase 2 [Chelmon rostratus]XP_041793278.1 sulfhydryl oxidase 2 [Chelmon rostratus]XP_041793279.1 sulfhydryl oxidase 2 [Chelmon rostratus]
MFRFWFKAAVVVWLVPGCLGAAARLYTEEDPLVILSSSSLKPTVRNSSSAWLVQFFSSWCGHCIQYSSTWKALAQDVKDWQQAVGVAVLDCAQEENFDVCKEYGIKFYPTFKYFRAHSPETDRGTTYRGADREIQSVRQLMVNILQNHTKLDWPDHCPPLEPFSSVELLPVLGQRSDHYTAIIIEEPDSYVGREVILDLLLYSGVEVKRALSSDLPLLDALKITTFPSIYLLHPNGTHAHLHVQKKLRFFFSSLLRTLPGVQRRSKWGSSSSGGQMGALPDKQSTEPWRDFDRSKVYTADLESALHYLLRVELATHNTLEGEELKIFKDFVTLVAKVYPGGGSVVKLMETLSDWLISLPLQRIPYQAILDLVDNKMRISGVFLGAELRWVGCQGSRAGLRGYPCALWTLFHVLTVQHDATPTALENTGLEGEAAPVLQVMRRYIRTFFGCQQCGRHFEQAAAVSMERVQNKEDQILWLWDQHNRVNYRLAGSLSDDPLFPKAPWPSPSLCSSCHEEKNGVHVWNHENVLLFLRQHYGASNLSPKYSLTPPRIPAPSPNPDPVQTSLPQKEHQGGGGGGAGERKEPQRKADEHPETRPGHQAQRGEERGQVLGLGGGGEGGGAAGGGVWILGLGFNSVDMSLCVVLYICSCLFLMLLFFFFKVRSRRWKLRYSRLHV